MSRNSTGINQDGEYRSHRTMIANTVAAAAIAKPIKITGLLRPADQIAEDSRYADSVEGSSAEPGSWVGR